MNIQRSDDDPDDLGYGNCPVQIEGRTHNGRAYYFRARGGGWALHIAPTVEDEDAVCGPVYMNGNIRAHFAAGWMPHSLAKALTDWALHCYKSDNPLDTPGAPDAR